MLRIIALITILTVGSVQLLHVVDQSSEIAAGPCNPAVQKCW